MTALRVLHVIPSISPRHGGPSFALPLFTGAIAKQGAEVTVATTDDDGAGARLNVPLSELVPGPGNARYIYFRKGTEFYKISRPLGRWLDQHAADYDVVHIHALFSYSSFAAARAARRSGVPYIVRPLGVLNAWGIEHRRPLLKQASLKFVELPILRGAAAIQYTADAERREAHQLHSHIAAVPSAIIPVPVEPSPVSSPAIFRERFSVMPDRPIILFLSRLDPKKGIELLLEAFQDIQREFPRALLVVAGSGQADYVNRLQQKGVALHCDNDIVWPGFIEGEDKASAFALATMFVLPSYSENFGVAAAEALAAGVPTVLSEQVAIAEEAAREGAALVVPCEVPAIAAAMLRLLEETKLREDLGQGGPAFIDKHYSSTAIGAQLMDLYRSVARPR